MRYLVGLTRSPRWCAAHSPDATKYPRVVTVGGYPAVRTRHSSRSRAQISVKPDGGARSIVTCLDTVLYVPQLDTADTFPVPDFATGGTVRNSADLTELPDPHEPAATDRIKPRQRTVLMSAQRPGIQRRTTPERSE